MNLSPVGETSPSNLALRGPSGQGGTPEAFGAGVARGAGNLAGAIGGAADYFQQRADQTDRFAAMQALSAYQMQLGDAITQRSRQYDPSGKSNFTEDVAGLTEQAKNQFLQSVPERLRPEFAARADEIAVPIHANALKFQLDAMDQFTLDGLTQTYNDARLSLDQDGSRANLQDQRAKLDAMLENSGLSEAQKTALRRQFYVGLEATSYSALARDDIKNVDLLGVGSPAAASATVLISQFNPQLQGQEVSAVADAAEEQIQQQIDPLVWAGQDDVTKAALLSFVATERELPQSVVDAIKSGDKNAIATAVAAEGGDQHKAEADVITGKALLPVSHLDADPAYADIPYEDRLSLRRDALTAAKAEATAQSQAASAKNASIVNALKVAVYEGTAGQADLDALVNAGIVTHYDDINAVEEAIKKYGDGVDLAAKGQAMMQAGMVFNGADPDVVKIENAMIGDKGKAAIQNLDGNYMANTVVPLVDKMKDIPPDVAGLLSYMTRANDQRKALWAFDALAQLQQASPEAFNARTNDRTAAEVEFWRNAKDYYPGDKLLEMLRGGDSQEQRVRTQALRETGEAFIKSTKGAQFVQAGLGQVINSLGGAAVPTGSHAVNNIASDYNELYLNAFSLYGDPEKAKSAANELIQRQWGVTTVGGARMLMKYPPDKMGYGPINGSMDWVDRQVREDLKLDPADNFQLVSDSRTVAEFQQWQTGNGPPPSYQIIIKGQDGVMRAWRVDENGQHPASRVWFDPRRAVAEQEAEFRGKQAEVRAAESVRFVTDADWMKRTTGIEAPPWLMQEYAKNLAAVQK